MVSNFFGFIGVLIVFRPGTSLFSFYSIYPLIGAFALSFAVIIMKKLLSYDNLLVVFIFIYLFLYSICLFLS